MPTETTIWLARHGEVHNPNNVLYGRLPRMRLTPEGRRQAVALAEFLRPRPLVAIYSSPMLRARRTAEVSLLTHPDLQRVRIDSDLQEVRRGWEGEPLKPLQKIDGDFSSTPRPPDDESLHPFQTGMLRGRKPTLNRHTG